MRPGTWRSTSVENVLVTSRFEGAVDFAGQTLTSTNPSSDAFVKLDPDGVLLWASAHGGDG
jgi:hypothetical protein